MIILGFLFLLSSVLALVIVRIERVLTDRRMRQVTEPVRLAIYCKGFRA